MKVYIAGKISGDPNYREKFRVAQEELERKRYIVLNPAELPTGMSRAEYMSMCLPMLQAADVLVLLPDWEDSPGARLELEYAKYVGKIVWKMEEIEQKGQEQCRDGRKCCTLGEFAAVMLEMEKLHQGGEYMTVRKDTWHMIAALLKSAGEGLEIARQALEESHGKIQDLL